MRDNLYYQLKNYYLQYGDIPPIRRVMIKYDIADEGDVVKSMRKLKRNKIIPKTYQFEYDYKF